MNLNIPQLLGLILSLLAFHVAQGTDANEIKIVCHGDSITKRGYPSELAQILGREVIHTGIAGNSSAEGLKRFAEDVISKEPTHVVLLFGTNDTRADAPHKFQTPEQFAENLRQMIAACQAVQAQVVLCTLPPIKYDTYFTRHETTEFERRGGLHKIVKDMRKAVIQVGKEFDLPVVDLNKQLQKTPEWMHKDGVHPSPQGNRIIAELVAQKLKPLLPAD